MRKGMRDILERNLSPKNINWLLSQLYKFFAIPLSIRFLKGKTLTGPLMAGIFVTYRCNSRCSMCDYPSRGDEPEMDTPGMLNVIKELMGMGVSGIGFTGGEPLLRKDIFELIRFVRSGNLPVTLNTNGILLNRKDITEQLVASDPTNINISLDSSNSATHDRLRGREGLFEQTTMGIKELASQIKHQNSRTMITVVTVLSNDNCDQIEDIAVLSRDLGAHRFGVMPMHHYEKGSCRAVADERLKNIPDRIKRINTLPIENSKRYIESLKEAFAGKPFPVACNAGYTSIFIDPSGRVAPCLGYVQIEKWLRQPGADESLKALWHSAEYAGIRKETSSCRMCYLNCQAELNFIWPPFFY